MVEDTKGVHSIYLAALHGHLNIVKHLASTMNGWTLIHFAAANDNLDMPSNS